MAEPLEVVHTGEVVRLGRQDYGRGWDAKIVTVAGEPFAVVTLRNRDGSGEAREHWFTPCGFCEPAWSGSKSWAAHVLAGVCFQCNGAGTKAVRYGEAEAVKLVAGRIKARARAATKREQAEAAREAEHAAWMAANAEVMALVQEVMATREGGEQYTEADYVAEERWVTRWGGFVTDLARQATYRPLSEKQAALFPDAVARAKADHEAEQAREAAQRFYGVQDDKVKDVEGTVTVRATYETFYGGPAQLNCLLVITGHGEFEGVTFKVQGTGKTLWDAGKGDTVTVSGKVKKHEVYEGTKQTVLTFGKIKVLASA